jgi:hypothetical protein
MSDINWTDSEDIKQWQDNISALTGVTGPELEKLTLDFKYLNNAIKEFDLKKAEEEFVSL